MSHPCKTCGADVPAPGHLCNPLRETFSCNFCGKKELDITHMCTQKLSQMKYVCGECGRVAETSEMVCKPQLISQSGTAF